MRGRVRAEAPRRLLQLARRAGRVAARRVVPRDRDVDEPLEEVPLGLRGVAPFVLQRLVGVEPSLVAHQPDSLLQRHRPGSSRPGTVVYRGPCRPSCSSGSTSCSARSSRGCSHGYRLVTSDSADAPDLVICDISRVEAEDVADAWPEMPILGFTNHTDTHGLQRAHAAGFDQVIVKSALVERARQVVDELVGVA